MYDKPDGEDRRIDQKGINQLHHLTPTTLPTPPSTSSTSFLPYTFNQIIEADHASLSQLADQAVRPDTTPSARLSYITKLFWRLVRHDISEELVMRPVLEHCLGEKGTAFVARDVKDHMGLKQQLLVLFEDLNTKPEQQVDVNDLVRHLKALTAEMAEHMREESRVWLPELESHVGKIACVELGRRYAATLVLTPEVQIAKDVVKDTHGDDVSESLRIVPVLKYARTDINEFRKILTRLEGRAEQGIDGGYFARLLREELADVGLATNFSIDVDDSTTSGIGGRGDQSKL